MVIAIDAGTTSITVLLINENGEIIQKESQEIKQYYPQPGWVEHDPEEILAITQKFLRKLTKGRDIKAIGITNQRETTILWNKKTGKPLHRAIVWQCRRTADYCKRINKKYGKLIREKTGLITDAYFSASKINWLLTRYSKVDIKNILFGTVDTWLIWNLTNKKIHATDFTNASRTLLYNIKTKEWDDELLKIFKVPKAILPEVKNSQADYGRWQNIPITGVVGDQQASLFGQGGVKAGQAKNTYGTGCFFLVNTGRKFIKSKNNLLTTLACNQQGAPVYALEGSVFIAGALLRWLRDELKIIKNYQELRKIKLGINDQIYLVPAFTGLGAPYWNPTVKGLITGLTRGTNREDIIRAALEAIAWQTKDLINAVEKDLNRKIKEIYVDGGVTYNYNLLQFQADILNRKIIKAKNVETTALGAAYLAGIVPVYSQQIDKVFTPKMNKGQVRRLEQGWRKAVKQCLTGN